MLCEKCGFQVGESAKFCQECGSSLSKQCDSCGTELPARAKFCPECGASISSTKPLDKGEQSVIVDVAQSQIAPDVDLPEYTGFAFLLPGTELWFGKHRETSRNIGVTRDINVINIGRNDEGFPIANWSGERWSGWNLSGIELAWHSEGEFSFRERIYSSPLLRTAEYEYEPYVDVHHLYLVNSSAIPAPDLQDEAAVILPIAPSDSQSIVEMVNQALIEEGWKRKGLGINLHTFLTSTMQWYSPNRA